MSGGAARTQPCGKGQARARLADAHAQLELAGLASTASSPQERKAAVACAVMAGIAAADAACCAVLSTRSRSQNHRDAADLLQTIEPGGTVAGKQFRRLIGLKDAAQYGFDDIGAQTLVAAQRQARALVTFAERVLAG